jgi:hypothetical protein
MTTKLEPHDRAAMEAAIVLEREANPADMAALELTSTWDELAIFAVGRCQDRSLKLKAWECPPADTHDEDEPADVYGRRPQEIALLRKMLSAGVSRFHPSPLDAIAEREQAAAPRRAIKGRQAKSR